MDNYNQYSRMLNTSTTKSGIIQLARAMKRSYMEDPYSYSFCRPFRRMREVLEDITLDNFDIPYFPKKVS